MSSSYSHLVQIRVPKETGNGLALSLEHLHLDLSRQYRHLIAGLGTLDEELRLSDTEPLRTRRGNIRARLRMITLYDQAHRWGGLVASTDNSSELGRDFGRCTVMSAT